MGNNLVSCLAPPQGKSLIRILHHDTGSLSELEGPLTAAEVMLDFPCQFLCACGVPVSASAPTSGGRQRIVAVPADEELRASDLYVLLPMHRLNTRFSADDTAMLAKRTVLSKERESIKSQSMAKGSRVAPLPATTATSSVAANGNYSISNPGALHPRLSMSIGSRSFKEPASAPMSMNLQEPQSHLLMGMASTTTRMCRSKSWMPKLETITET